MTIFLLSLYDLLHASAMVAAVTLSWHGVCFAVAVGILALYFVLRFRATPPDWEGVGLALLFIALGLFLQTLGQ